MMNINAIVVYRRVAALQSTRTWGRILALALAWAWVWPPDVGAADSWVARDGRDATGRGSRTRPWKTLQYAADRILPGDTVHVRDGDYEGFDLRRGGTRDASVCFTAEGNRVRIVRRNRRTPDGINVEDASYVVIDGFVVNEMPRAGVRGALSSHLTIRRIRADQNGSWGILTGFCDDLALISNQVSNSVKEHGIYVGNSADRPVLRGNISWNNRGCGIHMNGDLSQGGDGIISGALAENNIIFGNGRGGGSGINADGVQDSRFQNNLLYDNHSSGISLYRDCGARGSTGNLVVNNTIIMAADARWAVNIRDASSSNKVFNNILLNANPKRGSISISSDSLKGFQGDHNLVVDRFSVDEGPQVMNLSRWQSLTAQDLHSRVSTPGTLFVNEATADFHLRDRSPAIDAAERSMAPPFDIEGEARKGRSDAKSSSSRSDIGAYEYRGRD